jgi:CRP-like cAMP-binding protein
LEAPKSEPSYRNSLLASLPAAEIARLAPHLKPRTFKQGQMLYAAGQRIETIYFLENGICSTVVDMSDGTTVEVGIIGRESFVGMPFLLGTGFSSNRNFIQIPGAGYAVRVSALMEFFKHSFGKLRQTLQRGVQGLLWQTFQTAACNRVHELEERLARWLLMCHDRMRGDDLEITHEFLATMLGTRRSSVTVAAGMLQKAGMIECSRGRVRIKDRKSLEMASCECYAAVHQEYVRLGLL